MAKQEKLQSCKLYDKLATFLTDDEEDVRFSCESRKERTRQTQAQKKGSQNYWGAKDGALSETAKFGPLFLAAASLSPTWVWLRLGRLSQPGTDPRPREVINPVVTVHTRGPKRNQRTGMFCGIIPTVLFFKTDDSNTSLYSLRFFLVSKDGTGGSLSRPKFGKKPERPVLVYLAKFGNIQNIKVKNLKHLFILYRQLWQFFCDF